MLKKKSNLSYCDVRERYEHFRSRCVEEKPRIFKFKKDKTRNKKEKGCTEPLYGKKSKCVINIVPQAVKQPSIHHSNNIVGTGNFGLKVKLTNDGREKLNFISTNFLVSSSDILASNSSLLP